MGSVCLRNTWLPSRLAVVAIRDGSCWFVGLACAVVKELLWGNNYFGVRVCGFTLTLLFLLFLAGPFSFGTLYFTASFGWSILVGAALL